MAYDSFILCGKLFDILHRLGTYRRVVPIFYNTTVPAEFLFLWITFLPLECLSVDNNYTIKRSIVQGFHCPASARCLKIVAIPAWEIAPIVIHPFPPPQSCQPNRWIVLLGATESSPHIGGVSAGVNRGGGTNAWRCKMGAKFLANGWQTVVFEFLGCGQKYLFCWQFLLAVSYRTVWHLNYSFLQKKIRTE